MKQLNLHKITISRLPVLFLGFKHLSRGPLTIYYILTEGVYISMLSLCTLETACPFFSQTVMYSDSWCS